MAFIISFTVELNFSCKGGSNPLAIFSKGLGLGWVGRGLGAFPHKKRAGRKIAQLYSSLSECKKCLN